MPVIYSNNTVNLLAGDGDLGVMVQHRHGDRDGAVSFVLVPPGDVGRECGDELDSIPATDRFVPVRMIFDRIESIDVVIDGLRVLRDRMQASLAPPPEAAE